MLAGEGLLAVKGSKGLAFLVVGSDDLQALSKITETMNANPNLFGSHEVKHFKIGAKLLTCKG